MGIEGMYSLPLVFLYVDRILLVLLGDVSLFESFTIPFMLKPTPLALTIHSSEFTIRTFQFFISPTFFSYHAANWSSTLCSCKVLRQAPPSDQQ